MDLSALLGQSGEGFDFVEDTTELVLTFEVETEPLTSGEMTWIKSCVRPPEPLLAPAEVSEL